jgi:hypothetical protein
MSRLAAAIVLLLDCMARVSSAQVSPGGETYVQGKLVQLGMPQLYDEAIGGGYYPNMDLAQPAVVSPAPLAAPLYAPAWQFQQPGPRPFGLALFGDFLYLRPRGADVPFGIVQSLGFAPTGPVGAASIDFSPAFRAGAALRIGGDAQLTGTYTRFRSHHDDQLTASGGNVIQPLAAFSPFGFLTTQASSNYEIDFQLVDVDYRAMLACTDRCWLRLIGGASYGNLVQNFSVGYPYSAPAGAMNVATSIKFDGAGPQIGLEGERRIFPNAGLSVYGRGLSRFLAGNVRASYTQAADPPGMNAATNLQDFRIVPVLDLELGLAWTSRGGRVRVSGGYLVSSWFNTLTTPGWIAAVQSFAFGVGSNALTFDGLVAGAEIRF